jgi:hypothetical protein
LPSVSIVLWVGSLADATNVTAVVDARMAKV